MHTHVSSQRIAKSDGEFLSQVVFRSASAQLFLFIQVCAEINDFDSHGNYYVNSMVEKICVYQNIPNVTINVLEGEYWLIICQCLTSQSSTYQKCTYTKIFNHQRLVDVF